MKPLVNPHISKWQNDGIQAKLLWHYRLNGACTSERRATRAITTDQPAAKVQLSRSSSDTSSLGMACDPEGKRSILDPPVSHVTHVGGMGYCTARILLMVGASSFLVFSLPFFSVIPIMSLDVAMDKPAPATSTPSIAPASAPASANANRDSRIHTHSHIKGLGLAPDGTALPIGQGFVGQQQAREALGIHLGLLREGRYSGRPLMLVGASGTGKVSRRRRRATGEERRAERGARRASRASRAKQESVRKERTSVSSSASFFRAKRASVSRTKRGSVHRRAELGSNR